MAAPFFARGDACLPCRCRSGNLSRASAWTAALDFSLEHGRRGGRPPFALARRPLVVGPNHVAIELFTTARTLPVRHLVGGRATRHIHLRTYHLLLRNVSRRAYRHRRFKTAKRVLGDVERERTLGAYYTNHAALSKNVYTTRNNARMSPSPTPVLLLLFSGTLFLRCLRHRYRAQAFGYRTGDCTLLSTPESIRAVRLGGRTSLNDSRAATPTLFYRANLTFVISGPEPAYVRINKSAIAGQTPYRSALT